MKDIISYSDASGSSQPQPSLAMQCVRTATLVANCWTVVGAALGMAELSATPSSRLHQNLQWMHFGALIIAAALFSLLLPLYYVVRSSERSAQAHV